MLYSHFTRCWARRGRDRPQGHSIYWRSGFHYWRGDPNLHRGHPQHGYREIYFRVWRWSVIVSVYHGDPHSPPQQKNDVGTQDNCADLPERDFSTQPRRCPMILTVPFN